MCDYSLMAVPNRLAQEGEDLVTHRFPTGSLGLASPNGFGRHALPGLACLPLHWSYRFGLLQWLILILPKFIEQY